MRLFLNLDYDITSLNSWIFIGFTMENVFFTIGSSLIDLSFEDLFLLDDLFTVTYFAFVFFIDYFTLTTTVFTWSLALSVHTRSKLLHYNFDTWPLHPPQLTTAPAFPPLPSHLLQIRSRLTTIFDTFPLYRSARVTLIAYRTLFPFLGPLCFCLPPPPNIPPRRSLRSGPPPPPSLRPSSPY